MSAAPRLQARTSFPLRFLLALLLMGLTALLAQVILTRELLAIFFGNELSIALVLATWLVAVAVGSAAGARLAPRAAVARSLCDRHGGRPAAGLATPQRAFGWSQMLIAALLPLAFFTARRVQPGGLTPGQVLGPGAMVLTSLYTLAPVCLVGGFQFVLAARAAASPWKEGRPASERGISAVALVYALEAAGAALGGVIFHCYLAEHVVPFRILAGLGLLNILSACGLLLRGLPFGAPRVVIPAILLAVASVALLGRADWLELASLRASLRWSALHPVASLPSKYGALVVTEREGQISFFQSGVLLFTSQEDYANEVLAHLCLLEHPAPRRVLLIGGAVAGLAAEVLKHSPVRVDCVELDPRVVELARRWLPSSLLRPLADPRVGLHLGDGRLFIRNAQQRYDVIIVNLPDPTTASLNRFYTLDFLRQARRALAPRGLLCLTLTGSPHHLSGALRRGAAAIDHTIALAFPDRLLVPGETMFFLAASQPSLLSSDWRLLADRLRNRHISTRFVNDAWLRDALLPFRAELVQAQLRQEPNPRVNTDLNPISYYHQTRIWLGEVSPALARPMELLSRVRLWWAAVPLVLALLVLALTRRRPARLRTTAILIATAAIGGFGLVVELLVLLAFQSACGYLYHALGGLMAAFMAGLAVGSAVLSVREASSLAFRRLFLAGIATALLVCVLLPYLLAAVLPAPALASLALGLLLALTGSLVGAMFPVTTALYRRERAAAAAGGAIYAADLVGSAGAAVVAGVVAIPLLGAAGTSYAAALLLGAALVLALPPMPA